MISGVAGTMADTTTIEIHSSTWRQLNARKNPGDSFDDVISRLLAEKD
jgi:predicted CopG family antitoxin